MNCFTPFSSNKIKTGNRFIRSATCEYMADDDGRPTSDFIELYRQLIAGNIGIIITGYAYVMLNGKSNPRQSGIYSHHLIPSWQKVTALAEKSDTLLLMQMVHGGRQIRLKNNTGPIWAPSAVPDPVFKTQPQEMTKSQIKRVIEAFIKSAKRVEKADFHGIQLHVAHGYLLSQFLSPYTNRREDEYGGTQENRTRIVTEIISGIKNTVSSKFILSAKINGDDFFEGGLNTAQATISARLMQKAGLDLLEISAGIGESRLGAVRKNITRTEEGYLRHLSAEIKNSVTLPIASVGGYRRLTMMNETILSGDADFISICRPFIREPDLVQKLEGGVSNQTTCVSCNRCFNPRGVSCWHEK